VQYLEPEPTGYFKLLKEFPHCPPTQLFTKEFPVEMPLDKLKKHSYIVGSSGSGKSELIKSIFYHLQKKSAESGQKTSLVLIEPHGQLAREIRNLYINKHQKERLIYIDAFYEEGYTPVINPLELSNASDRSNNQLINVYSQNLTKALSELIEGSSLSAQMEALLSACVSTLLRKGNSDLMELLRFMNDSENQDLVELGQQSPNPAHQNLFKVAFSRGKTAKSGYQATKQSIYTKLLKLLGNDAFLKFTCGKSTINLTQAMDQGKVTLLNLSQGGMTEEGSQSIGKLLIAMIKNAALRRELQPQENRTPTFIFIDECQNYLSPSIEKILTEARKYQVFLVMANQNLAQIEDTRLKDAIFSNTQVKLVGRNSAKTHKVMAQELGTSTELLQQMPEFHFCAKVGNSPAFVFRGPSALANTSDPHFYLSQEDQMGLQYYLVHQKDYYTLSDAENIGENSLAKEAQESPAKPSASTSKATNNKPPTTNTKNVAERDQLGEENTPPSKPKYPRKRKKS